MPLTSLEKVIISDESGFACSKSRLVEDGLLHIRPFNISLSNQIDLSQQYRVPLEEAPKGKTQLVPGDILFNNTNSVELVGKSAIVTHEMEAGFSNHITRIRLDRAAIEPAYFAYWLLWKRSQGYFSANATQWVSQAAFKTLELRKLSIELPPMSEQRRIVDLLSRAEGIVRLRREAQQRVADLVPAIFLDMFGDPASNPKGWQVATLGDYLAINSSVRTPNLSDEADLPCIGADSIESATGKIVSWPTVDEIRPISGKYLFEARDVLYSKIRPALRKVIVAPTSGYCSADMYPLRAEANKAVPEYVAALLLSNAFTKYAVGVSARAQMPKVNRETLFAYEHPLPPLSLQKVFAERVQAIDSIAKQQYSATRGAEQVFESLLARNFSTGG